MTYLLDTDVCIGVLRRRTGMAENLGQLPPFECGVSSITVYELLAGVAKANNPGAERHKVERLLSVIAELPFDRAAAEAAANARADLEKKGALIGPYDLLIAGQALAGGLTLLTNNVGEFQRVAGLRWKALI